MNSVTTLESAIPFSCLASEQGQLRSPLSDDRLTDRAGSLRCVECGEQADDDALGWRAYLTADEEEPVEGVILCPVCAAREFYGP